MFNLDVVLRESTKKLFLTLNDFNGISKWTLVGGTGLSFHIEHRISEDLDFFITHHKIDNETSKNIDKILDYLKDNGYIIEMMQNDTTQCDYIANGVKITFHTTTSIKLDIEENKINYLDGSINLASLDTLAAMKMQTILKHRTKSRDFYDIYRLIESDHFNIKKLLENLKTYYPNANYSEKLIQTRFLKAPLSIDDEGLETVVADDINDFKSLRDYFKNLFINTIKEDRDILEEISEKSNFKDYQEYKFGLTLAPIETELVELGMVDVVEQLLSSGVTIELDKRDMLGKTVLHYLIDKNDIKVFKKLIYQTINIPEDIKEYAKVSGRDDFITVIDFEKIVNRCLKHHENHSKIKDIGSSKGVDVDLLQERVKEKCVKLGL